MFNLFPTTEFSKYNYRRNDFIFKSKTEEKTVERPMSSKHKRSLITDTVLGLSRRGKAFLNDNVVKVPYTDHVTRQYGDKSSTFSTTGFDYKVVSVEQVTVNGHAIVLHTYETNNGALIEEYVQSSDDNVLLALRFKNSKKVILKSVWDMNNRHQFYKDH